MNYDKYIYIKKMVLHRACGNDTHPDLLKMSLWVFILFNFTKEN